MSGFPFLVLASARVPQKDVEALMASYGPCLPEEVGGPLMVPVWAFEQLFDSRRGAMLHEWLEAQFFSIGGCPPEVVPLLESLTGYDARNKESVDRLASAIHDVNRASQQLILNARIPVGALIELSFGQQSCVRVARDKPWPITSELCLRLAASYSAQALLSSSGRGPGFRNLLNQVGTDPAAVEGIGTLLGLSCALCWLIQHAVLSAPAELLIDEMEETLTHEVIAAYTRSAIHHLVQQLYTLAPAGHA